MADKADEQTGAKYLAAKWQALVAEHRKEEAIIGERILEAQDIENQWRQIRESSKRRFDGLNWERVQFNVGGESFVIKKALLAQAPLSLLYCIVATDIWNPDANGEYFFDRDPSYFEVVFEFVRDGKRRGKHLNQSLLNKEFEFFGLNEIHVPEDPGQLTLGDPPKAGDSQSSQEQFAGLFNSIKSMIDLYRSTLTGSVLLCRTKIEHWRRLTERIRGLAADAKTKITFNVSGRRFCTKLPSIQGCGKLSSQASGRWTPDINEGGPVYLLDYNPRIFAFVLQYLRLGVWHTEKAPMEDLEDLAKLRTELVLQTATLPTNTITPVASALFDEGENDLVFGLFDDE